MQEVCRFVYILFNVKLTEVEQGGLLISLAEPGPGHTVDQDVRQRRLQAIHHELQHGRHRLVNAERSLQHPTIGETDPVM